MAFSPVCNRWCHMNACEWYGIRARISWLLTHVEHEHRAGACADRGLYATQRRCWGTRARNRAANHWSFVVSARWTSFGGGRAQVFEDLNL